MRLRSPAAPLGRKRAALPDDLSSAIAQSWTLPLWPTIAIVVLVAVYLRGFLLARHTRPQELPPWRAWSFLGGAASLWLALASPIDALGQFLLLAHMTQHLVLMSVAPPLLVLGAPTVPLLRGLPRAWVRDDLAPWMNSRAFEQLRSFVMHPLTGWFGMNIAFIGWHVPAAYELALRSNGWHDVEHACFFITSLLFWWFVLEPWPSRSRWSRWTVPLYLISADLVNTALSASLAFGGRIFYPTYAAVPRIAPLGPLEDQAVAGAEMWVLGSTIFLIPAVLSVARLLWPKPRARFGNTSEVQVAIAPPAQPFDVLRLPIAGAFLRARYGRTALQVISALALVFIVLDGLHGTPIAFLNLAGILSWNVLRPLFLLALLALGNVFCLACPFTLPRELARRLGIARLRWPARLGGKWIAIALLILFFWAYEQFALWDSPRTTALILLAYPLTALAVDSLFVGGNFCKHLCPIGQFNFVAASLAPLDLRARSQAVCTSCSTHDCIRGNATQRGCELQLYMPTKAGSLDCTLCMDCVKACPHNNIALGLVTPARDLYRDPIRASFGRLSARVDIAALALVVAFSALLNAAYMIAPVTNALDALEQSHPFVASTFGSLLFTAVLWAVPVAAFLALVAAMRRFAATHALRIVFCRFALALLPLGLATWLAHLGFHIATSASSLAPALQHAYTDLVPSLRTSLGLMHNMPGMMAACRPSDLMLMPGAKGFSLLSIQVALLDIGLLTTLYAGWRITAELAETKRARLAINTLWIAACCAFYAVALWIFLQPMQMRGMAM